MASMPTASWDPRWAPPTGSAPTPVPVGSRRRGRALLWVAVGLLGAGLLFALLGFGGLVVTTPLSDQSPAMTVPGQRSIDLSDSSTYTVYLEQPAAATGEDVPDIVVLDPRGDEVLLRDPPFEESYTSTDGYDGRAVAVVVPSVTGPHRFVTSVPGGSDVASGARVVVVDDGGTASMVAVVLFFFGGVLLVGGFGTGVAWLVVRARPLTSTPG